MSLLSLWQMVFALLYSGNGYMDVNTTKCSDDTRSVKLDQMIQSALREEPNNCLRSKDEIIDFIMANLDLPISYDQLVFLLWRSSPAISPMM